MPRPLLVNAAELLRRPGTQRDIDLQLAAIDVGIDDERLVTGQPVGVQLRLESLTDGIVVAGSIRLEWQGTCRRCLRPLAGDLSLPVRELYQAHPTDPDAFPLDGDQLDLETMVRETVLLDLPLTPLCSEECEGLCPVCGADRNSEDCSCETTVVDERWAALDQLRQELDVTDDG